MCTANLNLESMPEKDGQSLTAAVTWSFQPERKPGN